MKYCRYCNFCCSDDIDFTDHLESHSGPKIITSTYLLRISTLDLIVKGYFKRRNRNIAMCDGCGKVMRKDSLKRHRQVCKTNNKKNDLELNVGVQCTSADLQAEVIRDSKLYDDKIRHGEMIWNMIRAGEIKEKSFSGKNK